MASYGQIKLFGICWWYKASTSPIMMSVSVLSIPQYQDGSADCGISVLMLHVYAIRMPLNTEPTILSRPCNRDYSQLLITCGLTCLAYRVWPGGCAGHLWTVFLHLGNLISGWILYCDWLWLCTDTNLLLLFCYKLTKSMFCEIGSKLIDKMQSVTGRPAYNWSFSVNMFLLLVAVLCLKSAKLTFKSFTVQL